MRYEQSRPQSAELLRMALAEMARHDAALNPLTFTVWYEHLAGVNPRLSAALRQRLADGAPIDDEAVRQLHACHVADMDEATAERVSADFGRVMQDLSDAAASAGESAATFGGRLGDIRRTLAEGGGPTTASLIGPALDWTETMKRSVDHLQGQVATSRQEIERLREDLRKSREEALTCPLTRLLNRKGFDHRLAALLKDTQTAEAPHCLVLIDIDHFKLVNDTHGHLVGDRVLAGLGELMQRLLARDGVSVARFGGEEFAVLLRSTPLEQAATHAERLRAGVKRMRVRRRDSDETIVTVTVSAGVAALGAQDDALSLIARADEALYKSKQAGRDRVTIAHG